LATTDAISWRNNANGADIALNKNASDQLILSNFAANQLAAPYQFNAGGWAGTSACVTSTKAITFAAPVAFTSTPVILVFDETTAGGAKLTAKSNTGFTVSCTGATDAFDWIVVGNP